MEESSVAAFKNAEGYMDYTAGFACNRVYQEQMMRQREMDILEKEIIVELTGCVRQFLKQLGYELVGITYRDSETGREWKKK